MIYVVFGIFLCGFFVGIIVGVEILEIIEDKKHDRP